MTCQSGSAQDQQLGDAHQAPSGRTTGPHRRNGRVSARQPDAPAIASSSHYSLRSSSLGVHDLRFPTRTPLLTLPGHVNSFSVDLGLASWQDNFLAAAGQDCR